VLHPLRAGKILIPGALGARVGDQCSCPIKGHDGCKIAEGNPRQKNGGGPVAYEGHKTSCGATLLASTAKFHSG